MNEGQRNSCIRIDLQNLLNKDAHETLKLTRDSEIESLFSCDF